MPNTGDSLCEHPSLQIQQQTTSARTRDPLALASDALKISWSQFRLTDTFLPVRILPPLLQKIEQERTVILIKPN